MNRKLVAFVAASLAFAGSAAVAAPQTVTREATVNYADLNLESPAGVERLYTRIRSAARQVCGAAEHRDFAARNAVRSCRSAAVANAVAKVDSPALSARHAGKREARYAQVRSGSRD